MDVVANDFKIKVFCYNCEDCNEQFYVEELQQPYNLNCPYCGGGDIGISSDHLDELYKSIK
ncbi:hypothetical protein [Sporosarcina psychrophila]|uniref:Zn finger protein HypA/HybF involved in hydrogenase expression n=1 Tax=Sporosarcina psychrophila TaxID=1476 RepID=A0ABV2KEX8_SPOPS